jgi:hypothetical protein
MLAHLDGGAGEDAQEDDAGEQKEVDDAAEDVGAATLGYGAIAALHR